MNIFTFVKIYKRYGESTLKQSFAFLTREQKAEFETMLVEERHRLAYEPGTAEWRFVEYIKELASKETA